MTGHSPGSEIVLDDEPAARADPAHAVPFREFGVSDTINFAPSLSGSTLTLTEGALELTVVAGATTTIEGGGEITVSGNNASQVFLVDTGAQAILSGLTIENGNPGSGNNGGTRRTAPAAVVTRTAVH